MANFADAPIRKVNVNLFTADIEYLKMRYQQGYTTVIRLIIKRAVKAMKEDEHNQRASRQAGS